MNKIKNIIISDPVLKIFDSTKPIVIEADSSKDSLGTCLLQDNHPIQFASRSLIDNVLKWAQIEKELLTICFSFKKFHNLVYGRKVTVRTDHKPLINLINKPIQKISSRLLKMVMFLFKYDFTLTYVPGTKLFIADPLSRDVKNNTNHIEKFDFEKIKEIHEVTVRSLPLSPKKLQEFKDATNDDEVLTAVKNFTVDGWPRNISSLSSSVKHYYKICSSLAIEDEILFLEDKIVVPEKLRPQILRLLHESHFGIEKTLSTSSHNPVLTRAKP